MKSYYDKKDGYRETIKEGLTWASSFGRSMSKGKGKKEEQLSKLKNEIQSAEAIVIGAGAGLSTSAGFTYSGERFERYFFDFAKKYKRFSKNTSFVLNNKPEKEFLEKYLANKKNNTILLASFYGVFRDSEIFKNIFEALKGLPILFRMKGSGFQKKIIEDISKQYKNVEVGDEFYYKDLPILYGDVDIIVSLYSNKDENTNLALGNKFFEAMALKKIALFPEKTKMGELAKKNSFGLVVNPYNIQDIRKAFLEILENSEIFAIRLP